MMDPTYLSVGGEPAADVTPPGDDGSHQLNIGGEHAEEMSNLIICSVMI